MGLDMYLTVDYYLSAYDFRREQAKKDKEVAKEIAVFDSIVGLMGIEPKDLPECNSISMDIQVGYWRKANAIHNWFVNNVQNGNDNCEKYYVSREQIEELAALCERIVEGIDFGEVVMEGPEPWSYETYPNLTFSEEVEDLINDELPPQGGFFFGPTDLGAWYATYVKDTAEMLRKLLNMPELENYDFRYQSSW